MQEYLDVLDEDGRSTGCTALRDRVHRDGLWHRTVHVWLRNTAGELLLQRRAANKETWPDRWDVSAAGHIEAGGGSRDAAVRETAEELDVAIRPSELVFVAAVHTQTVTQTPPIRDHEITDIYIVTRDLRIESLRLQVAEVAEVQWVAETVLRRRVKAGDPTLVPHPEEYAMLFAFLDSPR